MTEYPKPASIMLWRAGKAGTVVNKRGGMVAVTFYEDDAPYIARAANAFSALVEALEIIAGKRQCVDNTMSNAAVAEWALRYARGESQP